MSNGEIIEQGDHDELYAKDGMYRGLVDAQRILAETTGAEEEQELERTSTIASIEVRETNSGVVAKTKYSLWYLLKRVRQVYQLSDGRHFLLIELNAGFCVLDGCARSLLVPFILRWRSCSLMALMDS